MEKKKEAGSVQKPEKPLSAERFNDIHAQEIDDMVSSAWSAAEEDAWKRSARGGSDMVETEGFFQVLKKQIEKKFPREAKKIDLYDLLQSNLIHRAKAVKDLSEKIAEEKEDNERKNAELKDKEIKLDKELNISELEKKIQAADAMRQEAVNDFKQHAGIPDYQSIGDLQAFIKKVDKKLKDAEHESENEKKEIENASWWAKKFSSKYHEKRITAEGRIKKLNKGKIEPLKTLIKALKKAAASYTEARKEVEVSDKALQDLRKKKEAQKKEPGFHAAQLAVEESKRNLQDRQQNLDAALNEFMELNHIQEVGTAFRNDWPDWRLDSKDPINRTTYREQIMSDVNRLIEEADSAAEESER